MITRHIPITDRIANFVGVRLKTVRSGRWGRSRFWLTTAIYRLLPLLGYDYSRLVEWNFVLTNLPRRQMRVLDVGANLSLFLYELAGRGYDTFGIDFTEYAECLPSTIKFSQCDAMSLPFGDDSFDVVTMISVIEHVGLGAYATPEQDGGDIRTMQELRRILRRGGAVYLTTNIAGTHRVIANGAERHYDQSRLAQLTAEFAAEKQVYYQFVAGRWRATCKVDAFSPAPGHFGLACLVLRKT